MSVEYNSLLGSSRVRVLGDLHTRSIIGLTSLDVVDTLSCTSLSAADMYNKAQVDALITTAAPTIADGSLTIAMTAGLQTKLDDSKDIQLAAQASLAGTAQALVYTQQDLTALSSVVDGKAAQSPLTLSVNSTMWPLV